MLWCVLPLVALLQRYLLPDITLVLGWFFCMYNMKSLILLTLSRIQQNQNLYR